MYLQYCASAQSDARENTFSRKNKNDQNAFNQVLEDRIRCYERCYEMSELRGTFLEAGAWKTWPG